MQEAAKAKAETIFRTLDTNGDGCLDEEEFCQGCLDDPEFAGMIQVNEFQRGSLEVTLQLFTIYAIFSRLV